MFILKIHGLIQILPQEVGVEVLVIQVVLDMRVVLVT